MHDKRHFLTALTLIAGVSFAMPASAVTHSFAQAAELEERGANGIATTLLEARSYVIAPETLGAKLVRLPDAGKPELFDTLRRGRIDVKIGERGNSTRAITANERAALVAAFGQLPWKEVKTFLDGLRAEEPQDSERLTALRILGALGKEKDLWDLLRWSTPADAKERASRAVRQAFESALRALLEREPDALSKMSGLYDAAHLSLVPSIITTLGAHDSPTALAELTDVLGAVPKADALVMAEISHLGGTVRHPIARRTRDQVRVYLESADRSLQIEGILACGRLEDTDAVPRLIELLTDADPSIRKRALKSLKEITYQLYGYDPADWNDWLAKATRWRKERAPHLLLDISNGTPSMASRAVLECSKQRFYRHELAPTVAECLNRPQEELVVLTCAALGHLGSPLTVPDLRRKLDHHSTDVKRAALLALKRVTGEDHGEDADAWEDAGW